MTTLSFFNAWFQDTLGHRMWPYQERLTQQIILDRKPALINKSRRTGISTWVAAIGLAEAMLNGKTVIVCSNKEDNAVHILEDLALPFMEQAKHYGRLPEVRVDRKTALLFKHGGEFRCFAAKPETARGYPADLLFFDEYAHISGEINLDKKMFQALAPSVAERGGLIVVLSTPSHMATEFARMWHSPDIPDTQRFTIHYTECPLLKDKVQEIALPYGKQYKIGDTVFGENEFLQEFCNQFDPGSGTAIPHDAIWDPATEVGDEEAWE